MEIFYNTLIPAIWIAWFIYWKVASYNVKTTVLCETFAQRFVYFGLLIAGALLLTIVPTSRWLLWQQIWPETTLGYWLGVVLILLGFATTAWARVALGRNWSSTVTVKENHELIQTGPYAWVRHPIYTGLLLMFLGTAVAIGQWRGLVAIALVLASFLFKLRIEEKYLTGHFGPIYAAYRKRVAMLIPWVW